MKSRKGSMWLWWIEVRVSSTWRYQNWMTLRVEVVVREGGGSCRDRYVVRAFYSYSPKKALERGLLVLSPMAHPSVWA
jgi:hypothetical protein